MLHTSLGPAGQHPPGAARHHGPADAGLAAGFGQPPPDRPAAANEGLGRVQHRRADTKAALAARGAVLDQMSQGAIIVGADRRVLFANGAARRLSAHGGFTLGGEPGHLSADRPEESARLAGLVAEAAAGGSGSMRLTRVPPHRMLAATIAALPVGNADPSGLVLITLCDLTATADIAPCQLMALFGLTAAEAAIVPQLVAGETTHFIAQSRGVAVATVRAQAARILAKTGAANLRALSTMVAALAA
jgi:DNA-binding CsgD family transcriptional regulator